MKNTGPTVVDAGELEGLSLEKDGVAFFRRALDQTQVAELKAASDFAYALVEGAATPDPESAQAMMAGSAGAAHGPEIMDLVAEVARSCGVWGLIPIDHYITIAKSGPDVSATFAQFAERTGRILRSAAGVESATLKSEISWLRRHRTSRTYARWHVDCIAAGTLRFDPCYNCWVPLVAVGSDCPGLEFMIGTHKAMRSGDYEARAPGYPTGAWMDANLRRDNHIAVRMEPGDVAVFDHYTLHRTQHGGNAGQVRTSFEMRYTLQQAQSAL